MLIKNLTKFWISMNHVYTKIIFLKLQVIKFHRVGYEVTIWKQEWIDIFLKIDNINSDHKNLSRKFKTKFYKGLGHFQKKLTCKNQVLNGHKHVYGRVPLNPILKRWLLLYL